MAFGRRRGPFSLFLFWAAAAALGRDPAILFARTCICIRVTSQLSPTRWT
jgi:hypothetical protein